MPTCYVAIGSNIEDREAYIELAIETLDKRGDIHAMSCSQIYETEPVGMPPDSPNFLNGVLQIQTFLSPRYLLEILQDIEKDLGRKPNRGTDGPKDRPIDLDLLLYGSEIINEPNLIVPHPRLHERAFVLRPLADFCPQKMIPGLGKSVGELLAEMEPLKGIKLYG